MVRAESSAREAVAALADMERHGGKIRGGHGKFAIEEALVVPRLALEGVEQVLLTPRGERTAQQLQRLSSCLICTRIPYFVRLGSQRELLRGLSQHITLRRATQAEVLARAGDTASCFFIVLKGSCNAHVQMSDASSGSDAGSFSRPGSFRRGHGQELGQLAERSSRTGSFRRGGAPPAHSQSSASMLSSGNSSERSTTPTPLGKGRWRSARFSIIQDQPDRPEGALAALAQDKYGRAVARLHVGDVFGEESTSREAARGGREGGAPPEGEDKYANGRPATLICAEGGEGLLLVIDLEAIRATITNEHLIDRQRKQDFFNTLRLAIPSRSMDLFTHCEFAPEEELQQEGASVPKLLIVTKGRVMLTATGGGQSYLIGIVCRGGCVGDDALLDLEAARRGEGTAAVTAHAIERTEGLTIAPCDVHRLPKQVLARLAHDAHRRHAHRQHLLCRQLQQVERQERLAAAEKAREKVLRPSTSDFHLSTPVKRRAASAAGKRAPRRTGAAQSSEALLPGPPLARGAALQRAAHKHSPAGVPPRREPPARRELGVPALRAQVWECRPELRLRASETAGIYDMLLQAFGDASSEVQPGFRLAGSAKLHLPDRVEYAALASSIGIEKLMPAGGGDACGGEGRSDRWMVL